MRSDYEQLNASIQIGSVVTCQMGNPSDSHGYRENVNVEVLEERDCFGQRIFLVREVGEEFLAEAMVYPGYPTQGVLYSTNARTYGERAQSWTGILTEEQARRSLGF